MTNIYNDLSDDEFMDLWDAHKCKQEDCELCYEFLLRFNPKRLAQLMLEEDPDINDVQDDYTEKEVDRRN